MKEMKCSLLVEIRTQDKLSEEMLCIGLGNLWSGSAQISIAHLAQTNAASAIYTVS